MQTTISMTPGFEPLPGYVLRERIGMGGFGEVWSVTAPGGLDKAIKLVHGTMDTDRANRELRSLERLRRVHHPFLLTLERYEIVANHLMIVTERADEGLDQVVARYQSRGLPGIPRDELLQYLIEAANALDHLRDKYGLQHLDIKPANLLVLSGHMKVADFGLVKDLRDVDQSIVGGLTPTYAAPEVFDGRPSTHSDQYSLAIVFQELLTGQRPFSGRTIAQLATQHVHSSPQLDSLPFPDRPVIARALEKNPERRFANCMEMIQRLRETSSRPHSIPKTSTPCAAAGDTCSGELLTNHGRPASVKDAVTPLPVIKKATANKTALILGIGGVGAEVLALTKGLTGASANSDLRYLLLDTDAEVLEGRCSSANISQRLNHDQTLHLPLRTAHEYRVASEGRLGAVSRRWIYNVPRSGKTEGLRPVGRLALADNATRVIDRLRMELRNLPKSADAQIFVVASLVGGTGGGMALDLIHLARSLLDETGNADVAVIPLLSIAWPGSRNSGPLQLASTHAALTEANYFANPINSYPGDTGAGFSPVPASRSPLNQSVLFLPEGNERSADLISDYLQLHLGAVSPVIDAATKACSETTTAVTTRSVKMLPCVLPGLPGYDRYLREATYQVVRQVLGNPNRETKSAVAWVEQILRQQEYVPHAWNAQWLEVRKLPGTADLAEVLEQRIAQLKTELPVAQRSGLFFLNHVDRLVMEIEALSMGCFDFDDPVRLESKLSCEFGRYLKNTQFDFSTVIETVELLIQRLESLAKSQADVATGHREAAAQISRQMRAAPDALDTHSLLRQWALQRIQSASAAQAHSAWHATAELCNSISQRFAEQTRRVATFATFLKSQIKSASGEDPLTRSYSISVQHAESLRLAMEDLKGRLRKSFIHQEWREDPVQAWSLWENEANDAFHRVGLESPNHDQIANFAQALPNLVAASRPQLLDCGGQQRRMLLVGDRDQLQLMEPLFREVIGDSLVATVVPGISPVYLHFGLEIPTAELTTRLVTALGPDHQLIGKLFARGDIRW